MKVFFSLQIQIVICVFLQKFVLGGDYLKLDGYFDYIYVVQIGVLFLFYIFEQWQA